MDSNLQSTFGSVDMSNSFTAYTDTMLNLHKVSPQAMTKLIHQPTQTILNFSEKKLDLPDLNGGDEQTRDVGRGHEPEGGEGEGVLAVTHGRSVQSPRWLFRAGVSAIRGKVLLLARERGG